jgi:hypothetical protein
MAGLTQKIFALNDPAIDVSVAYSRLRDAHAGLTAFLLRLY